MSKFLSLTFYMTTFVLVFGAVQAAQVLQVSKKASVPGTAEQVWEKIGGFCAIKDWHPAVAKCEQTKDGDATFRTLTLKDGGVIKEKLTGREDTSYRYQILESPLPVKDYNAVFSVRPNSEKEGESQVVWSSSFQAKDKPDSEARVTIEGIFDAGITTIASQIGSK